MAFCQNCGEKIHRGAKFCSNCGAAYNGTTPSNESGNQQKYIGKVNKCPNCGEIINSFTVSCPTCGFEFREAQTSSSVQELARKLEIIEASRPSKSKFSRFTKSVGKAFGVNNEIPTDEQKADIIRNYTIPNTKEDIFEFMLLASTNIDSKLFLGLNGSDCSNSYEYNRRRTLTDAWYAKFKQAYQKAEIVFGDTSDFDKIKNIYTRKKAEISAVKKKRLIKIIAYCALPVLAFLYLMIMAIINPNG